ncbi:glycosyl hydrolase 108 family protein [Chryseobacterium aurantiacum]|uniref:glycosyl hydrolase 108 family protein n=1 Tax=Chryseobacterium aurantiacum TaxID=2116499 RepID=UPI001E41F6B6|nr:glycosyl hydrolase 108 family protein [Chryseobacterium aurantiacum]
MVGIIIGNQNPLLGTTYSYEIKPFGLSFGSNKYEWYLYKKQKNGIWKDITGSPKTGEKVTYRFGEPGLGIEFEMKVYETKQGILPGMPSSKQLAGSMKLIPTSNKIPKIEKVVLFNRGAKDVNKASYRDTLIAQAHCIGMFNKDIEFHLWEDDAPGKGHNSTINKNNRHTRTYTARVNEKGIAEVGIPLMSDERVLRQMANKFLMQGDQNEGANHEYYITASYSGKIMGASQTNVDVANPDHKTGQQPTQPKSQPQQNTPKFPSGQGGPRQPDPKGNIIEAVFVDSSGKELSKVAVGNKVHVRIHSKNMVGKYIQYVIWEYDMGSNDEVYRSGNIKIPADLCDTMGFVITKDIFKKGVDSFIPNDPDQKTQNYFIEIISKDLAAESKKFGVSSEGLLTVENPLSPSGVQNTPAPNSKNCAGKYCIDKNAPPSELIREINIRLSGFGGNVPTDKFTDRTEKMVKQFQKDYMKVSETGKVCGNVLRAIDEFSKNFDIRAALWAQLKCSCSTKGKKVTSKLRGVQEVNNCTNFGDATGRNTYKKNVKDEAFNMYEYPGIHRSLLFGFKALQFYFSKQTTYKIDSFSSGYRCRFKNFATTNHQGKAIDMQFSKGTWEIRGPQKKNLVELRNMRDNIFIKYLGAQKEWPNSNLFSIEPIDLLYDAKGNPRQDHTYSWIHMDVREFDSIYLEDKYFCKNSTNLNGKSIIQLAIELGFTNTCSCFETYQSQQNQTPSSTASNSCEDKFKKVAPIILKHEGGYKNEPAKDKGDPTNRGISWPVWQKYAKEDLGVEPTKENQKKLTEEQATIIYRKRYWEPKGYCEINNLRVALMVYDWSITSGGAIKQVQKLLVDEFNQSIAVDGGMGKQTANALNQPQDQEKLLTRISEIRKAYYDYGASQNWFSQDYLNGLKIRVDKCLNYTL